MPKKQLRPRKSSGRMASKGFPNPIDVHVGNRIRLRRTLLGITQEKLADKLGLTFQQIQKYEKGENRVSSSRLFELTRMLSVEMSFFFDEMSEQVQEQTPSRLLSIKALPELDDARDPTAKRETLELVRAYYKIPDPDIRRRLTDLVRSLSRNS
jgi:transcriptional regulator with XRE-family HTH domain